LSVVSAVTKAHHGKFQISSDKTGACAVISLPVCKLNACLSVSDENKNAATQALSGE